MAIGRPALTDEQQLASHSLDHGVALLASAGSGKTAVLVERYLQCLRRGASPFEILTVTFTVDAAEQLRRRLASAVTEAAPSPTVAERWLAGIRVTPMIGTLHAFCYRLLDQFGTTQGLPRVREIITPFEFAEAFEAHYPTWLDGLSEERMVQLLLYFSHRELREFCLFLYGQRRTLRKGRERLANEESGRIGPILDEALAFWETLEQHFLSRGLYTFDDLEQHALNLLENDPVVAQHYQERLSYFLVDEFQDTSPEQWRIVQRLCALKPEHLFVVGDPKQSIYRFRNADYRVFFDACRRIEDRGGQKLALSMNFRSQPALLQGINQLSEPLFAQSDIPFTPMVAGLPALESPPSLHWVRYPGERGQLAAQERERCRTEVQKLLERGVRPGDIAILFRVSDRITDYFDAFLAADIPVTAKTAQAIFQNYETLDLSAYLFALADPWDDFALAAFLRSVFQRWDLARLKSALDRPGKTLYEKVAADASLDWFREVVETGEMQIEALLQRLLAETGYRFQSRSTVLEWLTPLTKVPCTLWEAIQKMESWRREGIRTSLLSGSSEVNAVQLMTVHGAKGLEFDHVFLVDNLRLPPRVPPAFLEAEGKYGLRLRIEGELKGIGDFDWLAERHLREDREESRRILYVALTRARRELHLFLPELDSLIPKESWADWLRAGLK